MNKYLRCESCDGTYLQENYHLFASFPHFCADCAEQLRQWVLEQGNQPAMQNESIEGTKVDGQEGVRREKPCSQEP